MDVAVDDLAVLAAPKDGCTEERRIRRPSKLTLSVDGIIRPVGPGSRRRCVDRRLQAHEGREARYTFVRLVCRRFKEAVTHGEYHAMRSAGLGNLCGYGDADDPFEW